MAKTVVQSAYISNVEKILRHLAQYKTKRASFVYRRKRHHFLDPGISAAIEKRILVEALKLLGVPFIEDRHNKRTVITVLDTDILRERLGSEDFSRTLEEAYRNTMHSLWGRS
ncbi:MAG: hypothetical protein JHC26_08655 [Thermofilum sp.]|jgi:hypothetical protein|uniref:hypothetical protein n=1 Tax=Thermofilum sp. TaxID=1961369 RepID=UPI0025876186|nr:hypothetical protein [Thermofilum sp.]MCI4409147.1 hypothetical protein [Thermofilum sp.]